MSITHQDIADKLGLSRTAVTRALHGTRTSNISPETRKAIICAAHELGYRPRNRTTYTVGLVVSGHSLGDAATGVLLRDVEQELRRQSFRLMVASVWDDNLSEVSESLSPKMVDGVLLTRSFPGQTQALQSLEVPFVMVVDEDSISADIDLVASDTVGTMERITRHLLDKGHQNICLASVVARSAVYRHMEQGIRRELVRAGLPPENLRVLPVDPGSKGNLQPGEMARAFLEGFRQSPVPTAVIAADEWRAIPIAYALRDAGYRIPTDVSFISLQDNKHFCELVPPITATTAYAAPVARRAVQRLLEKIEDPSALPLHERIAGDIIERGSVGAPPWVPRPEREHGTELS